MHLAFVADACNCFRLLMRKNTIPFLFLKFILILKDTVSENFIAGVHLFSNNALKVLFNLSNDNIGNINRVITQQPN